MRSSLLFLATLLLLLLAERAHGIRLDRQLHEAISSKEMGESKAAGQPFDTATLTNKHCTSDGRHCSGKAKRTLAHAETEQQTQPQQQKQHQSPEMRTNDATAPEANRGGAKEQETTAGGGGATVVGATAPRVPRQQPREKATSSTYPDILDIAGMDYSPATRKPPIHN
ncbi:hypothetical protein ABZP36_002781 [Zizania latifolia]